MATFNDYLRGGLLLDDYNKATASERQEIYNNWLKLMNQDPAPGNSCLRCRFILHLPLLMLPLFFS